MVWDDQGLWFSLIVAALGCVVMSLVALRLVGYPPSMAVARILRPNHIVMDDQTGMMTLAKDSAAVPIPKSTTSKQTTELGANDLIETSSTKPSSSPPRKNVSSSLFSFPPRSRLLKVGEHGYEGEDLDDGSLLPRPSAAAAAASKKAAVSKTNASPLEARLLTPPNTPNPTPHSRVCGDGKHGGAGISVSGTAAPDPTHPPSNAMLTQDPKVDSLLFILELGFVLLLLGVGVSTVGIAAVAATDNYLAVLYYRTDTFKCRSLENFTDCVSNVHCEWTSSYGNEEGSNSTATFFGSIVVLEDDNEMANPEPTTIRGNGGADDDDRGQNDTNLRGYCSPVPTKGLYDLSIQNIAPYTSSEDGRDNQLNDTAAALGSSNENMQHHHNSFADKWRQSLRNALMSLVVSKKEYHEDNARRRDFSVENEAPHSTVEYEEWRWYVVAALVCIFSTIYRVIMLRAARNARRYVKRVMRLQSRHALGYRTVLLRNVPEHIARDEELFKKTFLSVEGLATQGSLLSMMAKLRKNFTTPIVKKIGHVERKHSSMAAQSDSHDLVDGFYVTLQRPIFRGLFHLTVEVPAASLRLFAKGVTQLTLSGRTAGGALPNKNRKHDSKKRGDTKEEGQAPMKESSAAAGGDQAGGRKTSLSAPIAAGVTDNISTTTDGRGDKTSPRAASSSQRRPSSAAAPPPPSHRAAWRTTMPPTDAEALKKAQEENLHGDGFQLGTTGNSSGCESGVSMSTRKVGAETVAGVEEGEGEMGDGEESKRPITSVNAGANEQEDEEDTSCEEGAALLSKYQTSAMPTTTKGGGGGAQNPNESNLLSSSSVAAASEFDSVLASLEHYDDDGNGNTKNQSQIDATTILLGALPVIRSLSAAVTSIACRRVPSAAETCLALYEASVLDLQEAVSREHRYHAEIMQERRDKLNAELDAKEREEEKKIGGARKSWANIVGDDDEEDGGGAGNGCNEAGDAKAHHNSNSGENKENEKVETANTTTSLSRKPTASYKHFEKRQEAVAGGEGGAPQAQKQTNSSLLAVEGSAVDGEATAATRKVSSMLDPRDLSPEAPTAVPIGSAPASPERMEDVREAGDTDTAAEEGSNGHRRSELTNGNANDGNYSDDSADASRPDMDTSEFFTDKMEMPKKEGGRQERGNGKTSSAVDNAATNTTTTVSVPIPSSPSLIGGDQIQQEKSIDAEKIRKRKEKLLFTAEERARRAAILSAPLPPLMMRGGGGVAKALMCKKVSVVAHYKDELRKAAQELTKTLAKLEEEAEAKDEAPYNGAVFVVFKDAACAVEYCDIISARFSSGVSSINPATGKRTRSVFPVTAVLAGPPEELHHSSLNVNTIAARTFFIAAMALFVWLVFFYSVPVAALSSLDALTKLPYGIGEWLDDMIISRMSVTVRGTVQAYLPIIVLAVFHAVLPIFVRTTVISSGSPHHEETNTWQSFLMFLFAFMTSVVLQAVLQGGLSQLGPLLEDPQWETVSAMFVAMVSPAGGYWYALVIGSFIGAWLMAINIGPLVKALLFSSKVTTQHAYDSLFVRSTPQTQLLFSSSLVLLGLGILLHATVPIVSLSCGVFFLLAYMAARSVFLDIYKSPIHNTRQRVSSFAMLRYALRCVAILYLLATLGLIMAMLVKQVWWPTLFVGAVCVPIAIFIVVDVFLNTALWHPTAMLFRAWADEDEAAGEGFSSTVRTAVGLRSASTSKRTDDEKGDSGFIFNVRIPHCTSLKEEFALKAMTTMSASSPTASPAAPPLTLDADADDDKEAGGALNSKTKAIKGYRDTLPPTDAALLLAREASDDDGPVSGVFVEEGPREREDVGRADPATRGQTTKSQRVVITKQGGANNSGHTNLAEATVYIPDKSFFVDSSAVFSAYEADFVGNSLPSRQFFGGSAAPSAISSPNMQAMMWEGVGPNDNTNNDKSPAVGAAKHDDDDDDAPAPIMLLEGVEERDDAYILAFNQSRRMQIDKEDLDAASVCHSVSPYSRSRASVMSPTTKSAAGMASSPYSLQPLFANASMSFNARGGLGGGERYGSRRGTSLAQSINNNNNTYANTNNGILGLGPQNPNFINVGGYHSMAASRAASFGYTNTSFAPAGGVTTAGRASASATPASLALLGNRSPHDRVFGAPQLPTVMSGSNGLNNIIASPYWMHVFGEFIDKPWDYYSKLERLVMARRALSIGKQQQQQQHKKNTKTDEGTISSKGSEGDNAADIKKEASSSLLPNGAVSVKIISEEEEGTRDASSLSRRMQLEESFAAVLDVEGQIEASVSACYSVARYWHGDVIEDEWFMEQNPMARFLLSEGGENGDDEYNSGSASPSGQPQQPIFIVDGGAAERDDVGRRLGGANQSVAHSPSSTSFGAGSLRGRGGGGGALSRSTVLFAQFSGAGSFVPNGGNNNRAGEEDVTNFSPQQSFAYVYDLNSAGNNKRNNTGASSRKVIYVREGAATPPLTAFADTGREGDFAAAGMGGREGHGVTAAQREAFMYGASFRRQ